MRLLDKRALEKSISIKSIEKDAFTRRREGKIIEPGERKIETQERCTALRDPLNLPLGSKSF